MKHLFILCLTEINKPSRVTASQGQGSMSLGLLSKGPMVKINSQCRFHESGLCAVVKPPRKRLTLTDMATPEDNGKKMGAFHISVPHMRKHFTSAVRLWREKMKHSTLLSDSPINCNTFFPQITSSF